MLVFSHLPLVIDIFKTDGNISDKGSLLFVPLFLILWAIITIILSGLIKKEEVLYVVSGLMFFAVVFGIPFGGYMALPNNRVIYAEIVPSWNEGDVEITRAGSCSVKLSSSKDVLIKFNQTFLGDTIEINGREGNQVELKAGEEKQVSLQGYENNGHKTPIGNCEILPK